MCYTQLFLGSGSCFGLLLQSERRGNKQGRACILKVKPGRGSIPSASISSSGTLRAKNNHWTRWPSYGCGKGMKGKFDAHLEIFTISDN